MSKLPYALNKTASFFGGNGAMSTFADTIANGFRTGDFSEADKAMSLGKNMVTTGTALVGLGILGGVALKRSWDKLQNDITCKAIFNDLTLNDPIVKHAPKEDIQRFYSVIYQTGPTVARNKEVVRMLLQQFIKFGQVDLQTVKQISELEKTMQANEGHFDIMKAYKLKA